MITLRPYQAQSVDAVFDYWKSGGGSPVVDLATGLGKSLVTAEICRRALEVSPDMRIMMLVHIRELVKQNYQQMLKVWPEAPVGIYSAGLSKRDVHHKIIFASIQSVYSKPDVFAPRHLVVIDEAHLVPKADGKVEGMYNQFLQGLRAAYPGVRLCGLTATPFRMDSGALVGGEGGLFDKTVYDYGIGPATDDGWLCPLTARLGDVEIDVQSVARRGGEFVAAALQHAANATDVVDAACRDMIRRGAERRSWLAFCTGVDHAENVTACLRAKGISAATVTGKTKKADRDKIIEDFKAGKIRCLSNANVLTTGFDAPNVDMIAMLRPTLSTGLYVQMMGRGTRVDGVNLQVIAEATDRVAAIAVSRKPNCLVLDYAGNVRRHGPVDAVQAEISEKRAAGEEEIDGKVEADSVEAKVCPECEALVAANARRCRECGFEFGEPKHDDRPEDVAILSRELEDIWLPVRSWAAYAWYKGGDTSTTPTLRVDHLAGVQTLAEFIPFEHLRAFTMAEKWWRQHGGQMPPPTTVAEAHSRFSEVSHPSEITVKREGKFTKIGKRRFVEVGAVS